MKIVLGKIGVLLCNCRLSPLKAAQKVIETISCYPSVSGAEIYEDMCLQPETGRIKTIIREKGLDGIVCITCSSFLHQESIRNLIVSAGLPAHRIEFADLKAQDNTGITPEQIVELIEQRIEKLCRTQSLPAATLPVTKKALVIGGGIAGIQAALDIADAGYEVFLLEKNPSIGGHMIQYSEVFPTLDCPQCIMTPKMVEVGQHSNIKLMTYSEVEQVSGQMGNFTVRVRRKTPYIDWDKCTGCGDCTKACPVELDSEFNVGVCQRKAIYVPFAQAVPNKYVIDKRGYPPCRATCPAGVNAQGYIALISQGKFKEALEVVRRTMPFAGVCGRVCNHPCETECERGKPGEAVAIRGLKRFISDYEFIADRGTVGPAELKKKDKVAVVGSGPAGLACAHDLARKGYPVTVFEALPMAGGLLRYGIPEYRLPKKVLDNDIGYVKELGVEIKTNTTVTDLRQVFEQGYRAIFLGTGAGMSQKMGIPGEGTKGVIHALDFLRQVNSGARVSLGNQVAVIGGGNAAVDAARVARRLGVREVTIVYRRSRSEMSAAADEVDEAEREGIKMHFLATPVRVLSQDEGLIGIECIRMELGEPDASGRRRPVPVKGSEFSLDVDNVIIAVGQGVDKAGTPEKLNYTDRETLAADPVTLETNLHGVFAGGDAVAGPADVIRAISDGKEAAESIDRYLGGTDLLQGRPEQINRAKEVSKDKAQTLPRARMPALDLKQRSGSFAEVELGFDEKTAIQEARRCLSCAVCSECLECLKVCEPGAINHEIRDNFVELNVGAIVVATGFELYDKENIPEYENDPDILNGIQFERYLCPGGPTAGTVVRPSDGKTPKELVFISCAGSRDPEHGVPYCSRVCCMYLAKMAILYKHAVPDGQAYIFYMDVRSTGKGYEEFVQRAVEEEGVKYLRGRVSRVFREGEKLKVWGVDTLSGKAIEIECDAVVLGMAMVPNPAGKELAEKLGLFTDEHGFITEAHSKLHPLETSVPGIYVAGTAQGPKDIPDSVAHASGAASKVLVLFSSDELIMEKVAEH